VDSGVKPFSRHRSIKKGFRNDLRLPVVVPHGYTMMGMDICLLVMVQCVEVFHG
jgi:hypothetical protein